VAHKAGVSKGGLMYHFPTKEHLLKAMIDRLVRQFYVDREKMNQGLKVTPGRLLKAGILAALEPNEKRDRMGLSILVAAAHDPQLLEQLKEAYQEHQKELEDSGLPYERAAILSLAADGLMFRELLRLSPFSAVQRKKVKEEMTRMIDELGTGKK
jgi:AcrR family transcriptional regulator